MPEFNTQITPPEEPLRPDLLMVNEGDSVDENIGACRNIVETKVKNLLLVAIAKIEEKIACIDQVEDSGVVNRIDLLKGSLFELFQKIQFAQYDLQYGLKDEDECVDVPFELSGEAFETLSFLEGVTGIVGIAKSVIAILKNDIQELQGIIDRTQAEKDGLSDDKKFKRRRATLDKTINKRTPRKKKKEEKRKALVAALNTFLEGDPKNLDELWGNTKNLIGFLQQAGWMNKDITPEDTQIINSIPGSVEVTKIIIPTEKTPQEKAVTPQPNRTTRNRQRRIKQGRFQSQSSDSQDDLPVIEGLPGFQEEEDIIERRAHAIAHAITSPKSSLHWILSGMLGLGVVLGANECRKSLLSSIVTPRMPTPLHLVDNVKYFRDGTREIRKYICNDAKHNLDDESNMWVRTENARRNVEYILNEKEPLFAEDIDETNLRQKQTPTIFKSANGTPVNEVVLIEDYVQGFDNREFIETTGYDDPLGPINIYRVTIVRTAKAVITFSGGLQGTSEQVVSGKVSYLIKVRKSEIDEEEE